MLFMDLPIDDRLACLQELLSCTGKMYTWDYDASGRLLRTNCEDLALDKIFASTGCLTRLTEHAARDPRPMIVSLPLGLMWSAATEYRDGAPHLYRVMGPITTTEFSEEELRGALRTQSLPLHWRPKLIRILRRIPCISIMDLFRHTLMLQYCISGERLTTADIRFQVQPLPEMPESRDIPLGDRRITYRTEQALLDKVRQGDLNYKEVLQEASAVSSGVRAGEMNSVEQVKVSQIIFTTLCTRAAMEGGIVPEEAYSRGDLYIQKIMNSGSLTELARLGHTMYEDFIRMVYMSRQNLDRSPAVRAVCDYIEFHAEDPLTLSDIADHVGYRDYYLSRKFKKEMDCTVGDYIKKVRVAKARTLLASTDMDIQEISEKLRFGSRSFFSEVFRAETGLPPAQYRAKARSGELPKEGIGNASDAAGDGAAP